MRDRLWLTVPQTVVLEETRNLELALSLTEDDPDLRPIIANRLTARPLVIPLEDDSDGEARLEARRQFHLAKNALPETSRYLEAQERVQHRLLAGVTTKASRIPGGRYEVIDPVEFTAVELRDVNAVNNRTGSVSLYDLRIEAFEYVEHLTGKPIAAGTASSIRQSAGDASSAAAQTWVHTGNPVPEPLRWAQSRWGDNPEKLPNRAQLLRIFREQFGHVHGVNENTMRDVRRQLAPERARRGGSPMHRRYSGK